MYERVRTCFDCEIADIDPGYPATRDEPGDGGCAICTDPLATRLQDEYQDILSDLYRGISNIIYKNSDEWQNCKPGEGTLMDIKQKNHLRYTILEGTPQDCATFCKMFTPRTRKCCCCGEIYPVWEGEFYCKKCSKGMKIWEKSHKNELEKETWYPVMSYDDEDELIKAYKKYIGEDKNE